MRQLIVIGNWKMHGSLASNEDLLSSIASVDVAGVNVVVCPPSVYLSSVANQLEGGAIALGAQNVCAFDAVAGAYTGEVSVAMLKDLAVRYVLLGHSERRQYFSETDEDVAKKFALLLEQGLTPVLCIGESLEQRQQGVMLEFIASQVHAVIDVVGIAAFSRAVIAYEPLWAIGTGETATPEQAQQVHAHIRYVLARHDEQIAAGISLLYGGSVKAANAQSLFAMDDIDGALVGGASLKAEEFLAICKAAE